MSTNKKIRKKRKFSLVNFLSVIVSIAVVLMLVAGSIGIYLINDMLKSKPTLNVNDFESSQSTQIFDENGELIAEVGQTIRTNVSYDELPNSLIDAFVAVEDSRFFEHNGFDISRFSKAILVNIANMDFSEGGSTFTMQLVKNTYFTDDSSGTQAASDGMNGVSRKVNEIALAMEYENETNKKKTFELYVNKINFGGSGNIRGVEKAAEYYFNKSVNELNLAESAMLAGVVNSPYMYDPFNYLDKAQSRRDTVLYQMLNHGYITEDEYNLAISINVEDLLVDPTSSLGPANPYQAYIDEVVSETKELTGQDPYLTSMKIYTYMNKTVQTQMDDIQSGNVDVFEYPDDKVEIAGVSINNQTGAINGILGGRNYSYGGELLLNHATQQYKQPGSTVKPWLSYALAFEDLGWATDHVVIDQPITYRGTDFVISNSNGTYGGETTLKDAIGWSLNTPAIQALQEVIDNKGSSYVINYLNSLGFDQVTSDNFDTGYAIGGSTFEVTVVQSAAAQAMLMNGGNYIEPHTISRIEFLDGSDPIETSYLPQQVLSEESAYLATELLKSNVDGPYFSSVNLLKTDYPVYAKTGTSNWGEEAEQFDIPVGNTKDVWMVGSTSDYTVTCWYGYEKAIKGEDTYFNSERLSGNVRGNTVNLLLDANEAAYGEPSTLNKPNGVTNITHIISTFPYASAIEGMDDTYLTTGLINKKFASLVSPDEQTIESFNDSQFNVDLDAKGNLKISMPTYPDPEKLEVAPDTIDISLLDSSGNFIVEAYGTRLFDYSWIFGPIKYKVKILINDEVTELLSDSENIETQISFNPGDHIEVYGSYVFETYPIESNISTRSFDIKDEEITLTIPKSVISTLTDSIIEELTDWASIYGININTNVVYTDEKSLDKKIVVKDKDGKDITGTKIVEKQSDLLDTTLYVTVYEYVKCPNNSTLETDGSCSCNVGFVSDGSDGCVIENNPTPTPTVDTSNED